MLKIQIARSQNLLPKFWHTSYVLPKAAQNMYAPFTKNRREIVTIQKNDRLGFISFEKAFIMCSHAIRCNIHEFCCNGLQGVTWSYMALHDHLVCVTAIFFAIM
jgi:hypothetical protein